MRRCLMLASLVVLSSPSSASAGSASVTALPAGSPGFAQPTLIYAAAAGERNQIVLSAGASASEFVLRDGGAAVAAGPGCTPAGERTVRCTGPAGFGAVVDAGDGDDIISSFTGASLLGGDGDDRLTSTAGSLSGGAGRDVLTLNSVSAPVRCGKGCESPQGVLTGGPGDDILRGGAGNETLSGDGSGDALRSPDLGGGNDLIDGGPGTDQVSYSERQAGVRVDVADTQPDGAAGERDLVTGVEIVTGGDGADVLLGDDGRNQLNGGPGDDSLNGRGGRDTLIGGLGANTLRGGDGNDQLQSTERGDALFGGAGDDMLVGGEDLLARKVRCGSGRDAVKNPQTQLLDGCEEAEINDVTISVRPQRRPRGRLRFHASCHAGMRCELTLAVGPRSAALARRTVSVPFGTRRALVLRPRRSPPRRKVLEITVFGQVVVGDFTKGPTIGALPFSGRWRARL